MGADVEAGPFLAFDSPSLVRRMCSPCERDRLRHLTDDARRQALAAAWTAKEAVTKASGQGLGLDFRQICVAPPAANGKVEKFDGHLAVIEDGVPLAARLLTKDASVATASSLTEILGGLRELATPTIARSHVCQR